MIRLTNAAGWAKQYMQVEALAKVPLLGGIVIGSFTLEPREGNTPGTNFAIDSTGTSVNSLGLPNKGVKELEEWLDDAVALAHRSGKRLIVSLAGENPNEFKEMVEIVGKHPVDEVELNFGCPNRYDDGKQAGIISYSVTPINAILQRVSPYLVGKVVRVKLSPYANPVEREMVASALNQQPIHRVVVCNTFPNYRPYGKFDKPLLDVSGGYGGMGGTALHNIAVLNADHFRKLLRPGIAVVGVGGICNGLTLQDFELVGCEEAQIGTAFMHAENFRIFQDVIQDRVSLAYVDE